MTNPYVILCLGSADRTLQNFLELYSEKLLMWDIHRYVTNAAGAMFGVDWFILCQSISRTNLYQTWKAHVLPGKPTQLIFHTALPSLRELFLIYIFGSIWKYHSNIWLYIIAMVLALSARLPCYSFDFSNQNSDVNVVINLGWLADCNKYFWIACLLLILWVLSSQSWLSL